MLISLSVIGFLAFCYLMGGRAGFMGFWMFMRWPTTIFFGLCTVINYSPLGLDPLFLTIVSAIFAAYYEKLPDAFWDLVNLIMFLVVVGAIIYLLAEMGLIT